MFFLSSIGGKMSIYQYYWLNFHMSLIFDAAIQWGFSRQSRTGCCRLSHHWLCLLERGNHRTLNTIWSNNAYDTNLEPPSSPAKLHVGMSSRLRHCSVSWQCLKITRNFIQEKLRTVLYTWTSDDLKLSKCSRCLCTRAFLFVFLCTKQGTNYTRNYDAVGSLNSIQRHVYRLEESAFTLVIRLPSMQSTLPSCMACWWALDKNLKIWLLSMTLIKCLQPFVSFLLS